MSTPLPVSPFVVDLEHRFVLDEDKFMADVCEMPAFLVNPSPEYLEALDMAPVLRLLAEYTS